MVYFIKFIISFYTFYILVQIRLIFYENLNYKILTVQLQNNSDRLKFYSNFSKLNMYKKNR